MHAVEIREVTKSFGTHVAVDALSLDVPPGTVYGFIGPNGSGKTTTLRMIMNILYPDRGRIRVLGEETRRAASDRVGYLPEERGLYKKMKVADLLRYYAELKGRRDFKQVVRAWLERMQLSEWGSQKVEALSKGMAQKVQFIAAVIAEPELIILDEPFTGLDPVNAEVLKDAVLELKRNGATVIFSTHDMNVAEKMCDYIFMIFKGRKVLDGTLTDIQARYGADTIRVSLDRDTVDLTSIRGVQHVNDYGPFKEIRMDDGTDPQQILTALMSRAAVQRFEITCPSLQDIFVRIAGPEAQEATDA
ncbi:MAG: ATP-binding cassette domain-containing protein [Phycisphaerales bacterium]|nr:MAG: ATP-binding cassette domain-containing protein [Phycisphaerales bacterium]